MAKRGRLSEDDVAALDELSARLGAGSYYELLGVSREASRSEIRAAFFALSKRFHPDRYFRVNLGARQGQVEQVFAALNRAYETLSRAAVRRMYDAQLEDKGGEAQPVSRPRPAPASAPEGARPARKAGAAGASAAGAAGGAADSANAPRRMPRRPSAHVMRQLASRVRAREAEAAAKNRSVKPPQPAEPAGKETATALARELIRHASRDQLRSRGYLRSAEEAEQRGDWADAYRYLSLAQRLAPEDVTLIRRMEQAHRELLVQRVPENSEAARTAEASGHFAEAAMYWARVAEATDDVQAHVAAARNYLRCGRPEERNKAGKPARRAVELAPDDVRPNKLLLEFFEHAGMQRSAARQRQVVAKLKDES